METLRFAKHQALGNDFLIALLTEDEKSNLDALHLDWPGLASRLCDRRAGVGADGLLLGIGARVSDPRWTEGGLGGTSYLEGEARIRMILYNADGSRAEVSGNGSACLANSLARTYEPWRTAVHKFQDAHLSVTVETDAGPRRVAWRNDLVDSDDGEPFVIDEHVDVDMPLVMPGPDISPALDAQINERFGDTRRATGDVGNPHLVIHAPEAVDPGETAHLGKLYESHFPGGINVEFIWLPIDKGSSSETRDAIGMAVWERGAGVTHACGTGAVAAAVRARDWDLVVRSGWTSVHMPGGTALVAQFGPRDCPTLQVGAQHVADVEWSLRGPWLDT